MGVTEWLVSREYQRGKYGGLGENKLASIINQQKPCNLYNKWVSSSKSKLENYRVGQESTKKCQAPKHPVRR